MRTAWCFVLGVGLLVACAGCFKSPDRIEVNVANPRRPPPVDTARVPQPGTIEEAQVELDKAYQNIEALERDNAKLNDKADKYKRERDDCRDRLKKFEKDND